MQLKGKTYGLCRKTISNFQPNTVACSFSRLIVRLNTTLEPILLVFIMIYSCFSDENTIFKSLWPDYGNQYAALIDDDVTREQWNVVKSEGFFNDSDNT